MTRTQTRPYGVVTPPHIQPLLDAALRTFAWLVSNVVSTCRTIFNRNTRDWHTDSAEDGQLPLPSDQQQEPNLGPPGSRPAVDAQRRSATLHDQAHQPILRDDRRCAPIPQDEAGGYLHTCKEALMLRDREAIVSKHGGVLAALSPLVPTNVGTQGETQISSRLAASIPRTQQNCSWIPALILSLPKDVGTSGMRCGLLRP